MPSSQRLKIGINGRFLLNRVTGVERYARNILAKFVPLAYSRGHTCVLFAPAGCASNIADASPLEVFEIPCPLGPGGLGKLYWEQVLLLAAAADEGVSLLLNLTNTAPVRFAKNIVTIHDLAWDTPFSGHKWYFKIAYKLIVPAAARNALRVMTVSQFSKSEVVAKLHVPADKIDVVPNGFTPCLCSLNGMEALPSQISRPFLLHVGTPEPRKNLDRLLRAYRAAVDALAEPPLLVLAGAAAKHFALAEAVESDRNIVALGYVSDATLATLYAKAMACISASLYEGFGLPVLEAMANGTPVVVSDIPPHREILGDSGVLFDPSDTTAMAAAIRSAIEDSERLRAEAGGLSRQAETFTWDKSAAMLMEAIETANDTIGTKVW